MCAYIVAIATYVHVITKDAHVMSRCNHVIINLQHLSTSKAHAGAYINSICVLILQKKMAKTGVATLFIIVLKILTVTMGQSLVECTYGYLTI